MTPPVDIAGLRGLVEAATPGPWVAEVENGEVLAITRPGDEVSWHISAPGSALNLRDADLAFVLAARTALPALCDRVEELERERDAARREIAIEAAEVTRLHEENARLRAEVAALKTDAELSAGRVGWDHPRVAALGIKVRKSDGEGGVG